MDNYFTTKDFEVGELVALREHLEMNHTDGPFNTMLGEVGVVVFKDWEYLYVNFNGRETGISYPHRYYKVTKREPDWRV